ncbi:VRR-NUC domain-containing protein [Scleroderma yunnanense]
MSLSAITVNSLVFSGGDPFSEDVGTIGPLHVSLQSGVSGPSTSQHKQVEPSEQHVSIYVRVFEEMLSTVLQSESHLFEEEEIDLFAKYAHLSYNARLLVTRLLLRKPGTWYRLDNLRYEDDLGSPDAIIAAINEICGGCSGSSDAMQDLEEEREVINLTLGDELSQSTKPTSELEGVQKSMALDNSGDSEASDTAPGRKPILAENENEMDLEALLDCLKIDELKFIAKQFQLKSNGKKKELIAAMLRAASSQSTLLFLPTRKLQPRRRKSTACNQTTLPFGKGQRMRSQLEGLREVVHRLLVKCVRIDSTFHALVQRANLVFFRLTQYTPQLLVTALLPRFKKREYPWYEFVRSKDIWKTREELLKYEEALILEGRIDAILGGHASPDSHECEALSLPTPVKLESVGCSAKSGDYTLLGVDIQVNVKQESSRVRSAHLVKGLFESIYPHWQALSKTKPEEQGSYGLERFESGHVLTRIVCKGSYALGILGEYQRELEVLEALISQNRWRRGWRGRWHERRALILSTHFPKSQDTAQRALTAVIEGIEDPDTHIVYRPKLQRRLVRLEKLLKLPPEDCHTSHGKLASAKEVTFVATRIKHRAASLKLDRTGRNASRTPTHHLKHSLEHYYKLNTTPAKNEAGGAAIPVHAPELSGQRSGKTIWVGQDGEELTVEMLALQRYEGQGYKGIHCEARIIAMLFGLLFWDIIFAPIPGAFETPYQTAPLDIAEDSFYHSRKDLMETRLSEIQNGEAADIISRVDCTHRASETWCVGVQWDLVSSEDLVDIVKCIGGEALSVICRVLCEDYAVRMSGGPDLFLWNTEECTCKFVEVKGPGDTLQENQKVWIDILLRAPVPVEICRVVEEGDETTRRKRRRNKGRRGQKTVIDDQSSQVGDSSAEWDGGVDALPSVSPGLLQKPSRRSIRSRSCSMERHSNSTAHIPFNDTQHLYSPSKRRRSSPPDRGEDATIASPKKRPKLHDDWL